MRTSALSLRPTIRTALFSMKSMRNMKNSSGNTSRYGSTRTWLREDRFEFYFIKVQSSVTLVTTNRATEDWQTYYSADNDSTTRNPTLVRR